MSVTGASIISRASVVLNDTLNTAHTVSQLLDWLNDGQRELVRIKPDAKSKTIEYALVAGSRQALPSDGVAVIELRQNKNGSVILPCDRASLDAFSPNWMSVNASATVKNYTSDPANVDRFLVYPPQPTTNQATVLLTYTAYPTPLTLTSGAVTGNLDVRDVYAENILNYVLYRAFSKDSEFAESAARATAHYQLFTS